MDAELACRRLLLVASEEERSILRPLLDRERWEPVEATSIHQARFVLQVTGCDVILIDIALVGADAVEGFAWLVGEAPSPALLRGDGDGTHLVEALQQGALWFPGEAVRRNPPLLAIMLEQSLQRGRERRQAASDRAALVDSQVRIDRLLTLLWEAAPGDGPTRWFTQRYMLERLDEEVARSQRDGAPLSVVLGELCSEAGERLTPDQADVLASWLEDRIGRSKRRCDVAGQYGLHGFMLLLPQSSDDQAKEACKRLRRLLLDPPHADLPPVHACFGLASVSSEAQTVPALLRRAEERLDEARGVSIVTDTHDAVGGARS